MHELIIDFSLLFQLLSLIVMVLLLSFAVVVFSVVLAVTLKFAVLGLVQQLKRIIRK